MDELDQMTASVDLDQTANNIRAAADACGAMILNSIVNPENAPTTRIDAVEFPVLIAHLHPRLVYLATTPFDAHDEASENIDGSTSAAKRFISKWSARQGQTCRLVVGVMADGVVHCIVETTDWLAEFEAEAEALAVDQREALSREFELAQEAEARKIEAEEKRRLAPYVKKLLADPRFLAPKTSALKRLALAETIFADLDRSTIRKIVKNAESAHWLSVSGA